MKIEQPEGLSISSLGGDLTSQKASIAEESKAFLFEMLSKNLYSNPIGSIVREITSNCFDSHKEANVEDAVVISKGNDDEGDYIMFKDVGIGLSPERMKTIYMNYFSSTKRDTNDQIGGFGLGSKSPLAFANYFYITTNYDKKKYSYMLSRGESGIPVLDLLDESNTTERNGTEIKIHIKDWTDEDSTYSSQYEREFKNELKSQLCYFDNVYFHNWGIDNIYRIYESEYFKYRNKDQYSESMHIVLGKVCYPINWKELKRDAIDIAIGVKFEIGELQVTPNRESIRYTEEAKKLISDRVNAAYNECLKIYNEQNKPVNNYFDWFELKQTRPHITFTTKDDDDEKVEDKLYLNNIKDVDKKFKLAFAEGLPIFKANDLLANLYDYVASFTRGELDHKKGSKKYYNHGFSLSPDSKNIYITNKASITEAFAYTMKTGSLFRERSISYVLHNSYKKDLFIHTSETRLALLDKKIKTSTNHDRETVDIIETDRNSSKFGNTFTYFKIGEAKRFYEALKILRQQVREHWQSARELTEEELKAHKQFKDQNNAALQRKLEGKVLCKDVNRNNYSFEWKYTSIKEWNISKKHFVLSYTGIKDFKGLVIYGFQKDIKSLKKAVVFLGQFTRFLRDKNKNNGLNSKAVKVIQISQQNEKFFKGKNNMTHVDNLFSDNKLFKQFASSLKIEDYLATTVRDMNYDVHNYINKLGEISEEIADHFSFLYRYWNNTNNNNVSGSELDRKDLKKEILEIASKNNLFDPLVENRFKQIDAWFKDIEWMKFIEINDSTIPIILKELKNKKKKLNVDYYQKMIIEDELTIKGIDKKQLVLELVIQEETNSKFKVLTNKAA